MATEFKLYSCNNESIRTIQSLNDPKNKNILKLRVVGSDYLRSMDVSHNNQLTDLGT